jgi:hypothetical protein
MAFLRKIQRGREYQAPEVTVTIDPTPRHCAGSKTFKTVHCAGKFASSGRSTHAPWVTRENQHATNPDARAVYDRR